MSAPAPLPRGYRLRDRREPDDGRLLAVENRAAGLFLSHGYPQVADAPIPDVAALRTLFAGRRVRVVADEEDRAAGFAVTAPLGRWLHLHELSVDPACGRRGLGTALLVDAAAEAARRRLQGVSLTTFRDVPFNAPFYARLGFTELPLSDAPDLLRERFLDELPPGIDPANRILMTRASA